jgi:hypothetical protein
VDKLSPTSQALGAKTHTKCYHFGILEDIVL